MITLLAALLSLIDGSIWYLYVRVAIFDFGYGCNYNLDYASQSRTALLSMIAMTCLKKNKDRCSVIGCLAIPIRRFVALRHFSLVLQ
jgi:hypothetical protein